MKDRLLFFRAFAVAAAVSSLVLAPAAANPARQTDARGLVNIRVGDGRDVRLYNQSHALVVGVSDYTGGWPKLPGVKSDAEAVSAALERHGFRVTVVMNPDHTQLDKAFKEFISAYGRSVENRLLFYFAGHGHTVKQSYGEEMGYIVPADAPNPNRDPNGFLDKAMNMRQVERFAEDIQSKHALFLFDSCFSGQLFALSRAVPESISYKTTRHVRQFITSGSANEQVPDKSIFRRQFVEALEGEADVNPKDGYVTGGELGEFLQDKVVNYSRNAQHPQYGKIRNPNLDKGDFVFALPTKAAPPAAATKPSLDEPALPAPTRVDPAALDLAFWTSIQNSTDAEDYRAYLEKFPAGTYATLARRRVQQYTAAPARNNRDGAATGTVPPLPSPAAGWIEKALSPGIDFGSVSEIAINVKFPSATSVKADLKRVGAQETIFDSFGGPHLAPERWVINIGSKIDVRAAQAVIAACLKNTDKVWTVWVMKKDGNLNRTSRVYVGGLDEENAPGLSREQLLLLLDPNLTAERLYALMPEKK